MNKFDVNLYLYICLSLHPSAFADGCEYVYVYVYACVAKVRKRRIVDSAGVRRAGRGGITPRSFHPNDYLVISNRWIRVFVEV